VVKRLLAGPLLCDQPFGEVNAALIAI